LAENTGDNKSEILPKCFLTYWRRFFVVPTKPPEEIPEGFHLGKKTTPTSEKEDTTDDAKKTPSLVGSAPAVPTIDNYFISRGRI